jgi:hypothetical protein
MDEISRMNHLRGFSGTEDAVGEFGSTGMNPVFPEAGQRPIAL